jgi:hypothetical protein
MQDEHVSTGRDYQFPMQDAYEMGKNGVGVARPGAETDAECEGLSQGGPASRSSSRAARGWNATRGWSGC